MKSARLDLPYSMPPPLAWLTAINIAHEFVSDHDTAKQLACHAIEDWQAFAQERESMARRKRLIEGRS